MITYIVKTVLCAAILLLVYFLLLEREKMHRFKRFYLLFSIVFSFTVPSITIENKAPVMPVTESMILQTIGLPTSSSPQTLASTSASTPVSLETNHLLPNLLILLYIVVTTFLLVRFIRNLSSLLFKVTKNKSIKYQGAVLILTNDNYVPHSFLSYIFIDRNKFEQGAIEKEILQHELTHVNQKHSIDILIVELAIVFAWFNPLLFLYRKAIMLNHEYLADEAVVNRFNDTETYRQLLFAKVCRTQNLVLSSSFNYLITKKRLIMMTQKTSMKVAILKQIALIPLIAAIGFFFSTTVNAQDTPKQSAKQKQVETNKTDAPKSVFDEYAAILVKYKIDIIAIQQFFTGPERSSAEMKKAGILANFDTLKDLDKSDRNRLEQLYFQMSQKQKDECIIHFQPKSVPQPNLIPTKEQLKSWKDPTIYGIWINQKRVKNTILNNHSNTDFYHYVLRPLSAAESKVMKYKVEVALLTENEYNRIEAQTKAAWKNDQNKNAILICITRKSKVTEKN